MQKKMAEKFTFFLLAILLLLMGSPGQGRPITRNTTLSMVSDGAQNVWQPTYIQLKSLILLDSCEQTYGFLPCTTTVLGNVFLILVYGYLMFRAAKLLCDGCEILLEILGPGIIGGLFLPVLSSLPDAIIILASGLSGSRETAQSQVSVGIGLLAGSTVMLLTVLWGSCLILGKCDLESSLSTDPKDTKGFSLTGSGVSTDIWTSYAARIMAISVIPFIIVQLPDVLHSTSQSRIAILIALIVSISLLLSYSLYQVFQPWIQKRRIDFAKHKHVIAGLLKHLSVRALGRLLTDDGEPNTTVIERLFMMIDENGDGRLSPAELRALVLGIRFEEIDMDIEDAVEKVMKEFDTSCDSFIDLDEFVRGISKWLIEAKRSAVKQGKLIHLHHFHEQTKKEHHLLGDHGGHYGETVKNPVWNTFKAGMMLLLGTIVAAVFADPLVDAVDSFSTASSIPSFFVSFVILPIACTSEAVSALNFAGRKKLKTASLTYSQIYGSVTMSNILSLSVFLGLVYFRDLTWDFAAEVLVILIVCIVMGAIASFRTTFPLWMSLVAYALYPFSLLLVYILDYVFGWS
ncbi:sodium/calcium exchanger NCL-like [Durio zibethinus]|uniref:Sodium/calcium exchanger NCL-like n=1 Tax=Durio zibethinus TaxID=66656 RepID=A0A6P6B9V4_DURZI|nr:sodium/calcium exchanger NCL-like [Durio zibethinus]